MAEKKDKSNDKLDSKDTPDCGHEECKDDFNYAKESNKTQGLIIDFLNTNGITMTAPNIDAIFRIAIRAMVENLSDRMHPGAMLIFMTAALQECTIEFRSTKTGKHGGH